MGAEWNGTALSFAWDGLDVLMHCWLKRSALAINHQAGDTQLLNLVLLYLPANPHLYLQPPACSDQLPPAAMKTALVLTHTCSHTLYLTLWTHKFNRRNLPPLPLSLFQRQRTTSKSFLYVFFFQTAEAFGKGFFAIIFNHTLQFQSVGAGVITFAWVSSSPLTSELCPAAAGAQDHLGEYS